MSSEPYDYLTCLYYDRDYVAPIRRKLSYVTVASITLRSPGGWRGAGHSRAVVTYGYIKREFWPEVMKERGKR